MRLPRQTNMAFLMLSSVICTRIPVQSCMAHYKTVRMQYLSQSAQDEAMSGLSQCAPQSKLSEMVSP